MGSRGGRRGRSEDENEVDVTRHEENRACDVTDRPNIAAGPGGRISSLTQVFRTAEEVRTLDLDPGIYHDLDEESYASTRRFSLPW
jgi:hypothetical protein